MTVVALMISAAASPLPAAARPAPAVEPGATSVAGPKVAAAPGRAVPAAPGQAGGAGARIDVLELVRTPGIAGYEEAVRQRLTAALPGWASPEVDGTGNLTVTFGQGSPHTLVVAPLDEAGHVVSDITEDGYLRLHRGTGSANPLFDQYHYGQPVMVRAATGPPVPGVFATMSTHIRGDLPAAERSGIRDIDDLWIDLGADSRAEVEALGVRNLDPVVLRDRAIGLAGGRVAGPHAQGRGAAAAVQHLLAGRASPPAVDGRVTLAWVAQSTFRGQGMDHLSRRLRPDRAVVFTTALLREPRFGAPEGGTAGPLTDPARGATGELGRGVLIADADGSLAVAARDAGIAVQPVPPLQVGSPVTARSTGWTDTDIHMAALPVRYARTPVELVDLADVAAATRLLEAILGLPDMTVAAGAGGSRELAGRQAGGAGGGGAAAGPGAAASPAEVAALVDAIAGPRPEVTGSFRALQRFIEVYGVSGHEGPVRELILSMLPGWAEPEVDEEGNVTVTVGDGGPHLVFVAHQDEVGWEVTDVGDDGSLGLRRRGGFLETLYEAHPALVHTSGGAVPAVVAPRAGYVDATGLNPDDDRPVRADVGTGSAAESRTLGIAAGDSVTVPKRFQPLAGTRATGRGVDDRVGTAALVLALQRLEPDAIRARRVTFAWSVEEEVGLNGAETIAERTRPDTVFAVDTFVSSASPVDWQRRARVPIGAGPVVKVLDGNHVTPRHSVDRILALGVRHGIPINLSITGGGTDAGAFIPYGTVPVPIGWPSRYSHSPVELMDRADLDDLIDLVLVLAYEY